MNPKLGFLVPCELHLMTTQPETASPALFDGRAKLGDRLKTAREGTKLSRDAVVERAATGFSRSSLQAWEAGEREPSLDNLFELAQIYGAHPWELLTGQTFGVNDSAFTDTFALIPAYDIEVSAGPGMFTEGATKPSQYLAFRHSWLRQRGLDAGKLSIVFTRGDSMDPTIPDGATIAVDMSRTKPVDGGIYVIRIDSRLWVKRVQWLPHGGLRVISDNPRYDSFDISPSDFKHTDVEICGQVVNASFDLY